MYRATKYVYQKKSKRKWELTITVDGDEVFRDLCNDLMTKKIWNGKSVRRILDRSNYDGTRTVTVYYDNDVKSEYIVDI